MFAVFPVFRLFAFRRKPLFVAICALLGCVICGDVSAAPGQLDPTMGNGNGYVTTLIGGGRPRPWAAKVALYPDGKIVVAGTCNAEAAYVLCVARYQSDGSLDATFGHSGVASMSIGGFEDALKSVLVRADGSVLVAGGCGFKPEPLSSTVQYSFCMGLFTADGSADPTFGTNGQVVTSLDASSFALTVATQADGKLVVAGTCSNSGPSTWCIARYSSSGVLDSSFGTGGKVLFETTGESVTGALIQTDQKILLYGMCAHSGYTDFCVRRFLIDGLPDMTFGVNGKVMVASGRPFTWTRRGLLQPDGKIVLVGVCDNLDARYSVLCLTRVDASGQVDLSFGAGGKILSSTDQDQGYGVALQADGKLVTVGQCGGTLLCLMRFNGDGSSDPTFAGGRVQTQIGVMAWGDDLVVQPDGSIVVGGTSTDATSNAFFALVRYQGGPYPALGCTLNVNRNLLLEPNANATLVLRYLLGLRGAALTNGALGANPGRTSAEPETYLADLLAQGKLDVDGDSQALAMTDGLLILRAMLGLTGTALTQGATNAAHPNVRDAQQILTWIESTHGVACLP